MAEADSVAGVETPKDFGPGPEAVARRWISELERAEKAQAKWLKRCTKINEIYTEAQQTPASRRYSVLWANIQTLAPAVYARTPTAVVSRRFKDEDPVGRLASEVLERALNFSVETTDFPDMMTTLRDEFLLLARGQAWIRYVPRMAQVPAAKPGDGEEGYSAPHQASPDGEITDDAECYDVVDWEEAVPDHVHWRDFLTNVARSWSEVRWVSRCAYLDRTELVDRFGAKIGNAVPLDWTEKTRNGAAEAKDDQFAKAAIYEIWDRPSRTVYWISKSHPAEPLDQREDPLGLTGFFPCPRPLLGTCGTDSIIPVPDYVYYQTQAEEINELTARIDKLSRALKVRGWYAASSKEAIENLLTAGDNELVPIDGWQAMVDKAGGVEKLIAWMPVEQVAEVLKGCVDLRKQLLDDVFQITGIADIMRGDTDPNETKGAQVIKANWGSSRVRDKQKEIARFARDLLRLMGEVIASRFSQDTLAKMTGVKLLTRAEKEQIQQVQALQQRAMQAAQQAQQAWQQQAQAAQAQGQPPPPAPAAPEQPTPIPPEVQQQLSLPAWEDITDLLHDSAQRTFRVDVETDSTIEPNDQEEKQRRVEFIGAIGKFLAESLPVAQAAPQMLPVIVESLKFLVRGFRVGREMEDVVDRALDQLQQAASQPAQPQANPADQMKAQAAQVQAQAQMVKAQSDAQSTQVRAQAENTRSQTELAVAQHEARMDIAGHQLQAQDQSHGQAMTEHERMVDAIRMISERELRREALDHSPAKVPTP
jgi:hypothetical protein